MVNKQGRQGWPSTTNTSPSKKDVPLKAVRKCLTCTEQQNELAILEFIHLLVETMDRHFGKVVSSGESTLYAGGNGYERAYCSDKQV